MTSLNTFGQEITRSGGSIVPGAAAATTVPTIPPSPAAASTTLSYSATTPIDASVLNASSQPVTLPQPQVQAVPAVPSLDSIFNTPETDLQKTFKTGAANEGTLAAELAGKSAYQDAQETAAGIPDLKKTVSDLTSRFNTLNAQAQAIPLQIQQDYQGRGATDAGVEPIQTAQLRDISIQQLGISAALNAANGNLATAQDQVDAAVKAKFDPIQAQLDAQKAQLDAISPLLTQEEQKQAAEQAAQLQDRQDQLDQQKSDQQQIYQVLLTAALNGADATTLRTIQNSATPEDAIIAADQYLQAPATSTAATSTRSTGTATPAYNGDFAATIDLAANANKNAPNVTKQAIKSQLQSYIANGDYASAYQGIVQQTRAGLDSTNATRFDNALNLYSTLGDLKTALQAFANAGGDTNILTGTEDQIQTKLGGLITDPKYASLAVQLDTAYQNYRLMVTGANFSQAEASAYASVLPSKGNTLALNLAKIDGAQAAANSTVEGNIKSVVGQGGIYIKQYAEGATAGQSTSTDTDEQGRITSGTLPSGLSFTVTY